VYLKLFAIGKCNAVTITGIIKIERNIEATMLFVTPPDSHC